MTKEEYIVLYEKNLLGKATTEELDQLNQYKDDFDIVKFDNDDKIDAQAEIKQRIFKRISARITHSTAILNFSHRWWLYAASILLLCALSLRYLPRYFQILDGSFKEVAENKSVIKPGSNKARLILGDGVEINLETAANGKIGYSRGVSISKLKDGQLRYDAIPAGKFESISYDQIIIPRGGQYKIILPDGTSVWLNSASSLRYPTSFSGFERRVELSGEAYFEVAKNPEKPFFVSSGDLNIKVLGTHFNVSAYRDESTTKTTLLEGSVMVQNKTKIATISPGQQAVTGPAENNIVTRAVNVQDAVDWKNGYFSFRKENVQSAMRKIARWYDIEVVYQGKISQKLLGGTVLRTENIKEILNYLETIGIAKFKIEGRRVIVKTD